jgi:hypothetical protein
LIVGNLSFFAIESNITLAYERLSFRALGFFVVHLGGKSYGKPSPDSTMLARSYDEVERRIAMRGSHTATFASERGAEEIAVAFRNALFAEHQQDSYFGISRADFSDLIWSKRLAWAPDGDEAFDDGSYVLHFDVGHRVRLIALKSRGEGHDPATLVDVWLSADDFYSVLQDWRDAFKAEWTSTPKAPEADSQ